MARELGRTAGAVEACAMRLGVVSSARWTAHEQKVLVERYPTEGAARLAEVLLRSRKAVQLKALRMGLQCVLARSPRGGAAPAP